MKKTDIIGAYDCIKADSRLKSEIFSAAARKRVDASRVSRKGGYTLAAAFAAVFLIGGATVFIGRQQAVAPESPMESEPSGTAVSEEIIFFEEGCIATVLTETTADISAIDLSDPEQVKKLMDKEFGAQAQRLREEEERKRQHEERLDEQHMQQQAERFNAEREHFIFIWSQAERYKSENFTAGAIDPKLSWPCPTVPYVIEYFSPRTSDDIIFHSGIDISMQDCEGQQITASAFGTVVAAETSGAYGVCVVISHTHKGSKSGEISTLYAHMSDCTVKVGDVVEAGQVIGHIGSSGVAEIPHCHFEVRVNGENVDPLKYVDIPED